MFVSLIRFIFGFVTAVLVAGVVQVAFVAGSDLIRAPISTAESLGLLALLAATQSAVFSAPFAVLAVLAAAWLPTRSILYFGAVGVLIAAAGFLTQYVGEAGPTTILNRYALAAYLTSGLLAGLTYWFVAVPKKRVSAS